jgi:hypothetical protein
VSGRARSEHARSVLTDHRILDASRVGDVCCHIAHCRVPGVHEGKLVGSVVCFIVPVSEYPAST